MRRDELLLTDDTRRVVLEKRRGFVATVCLDDTPNLSTKGRTTVWGDTYVVFAGIRSQRTVSSCLANPSIEFNIVDQEGSGG